MSYNHKKHEKVEFDVMAHRYHSLSRPEKGKFLNELCDLYGYELPHKKPNFGQCGAIPGIWFGYIRFGYGAIIYDTVTEYLVPLVIYIVSYRENSLCSSPMDNCVQVGLP